MSGLYISLGEYRKAQGLLEKAIKIVQPSPPSSDKIDPITFRLQMKEADLLLESYHFELGIELLENLNNNRQFLPHGARPAVLTKLAKVIFSSPFIPRHTSRSGGSKNALPSSNDSKRNWMMIPPTFPSLLLDPDRLQE